MKRERALEANWLSLMLTGVRQGAAVVPVGLGGAGKAHDTGPLCCDGNCLHAGWHTSAPTFCWASGCGVGGVWGGSEGGL